MHGYNVAVVRTNECEYENNKGRRGESPVNKGMLSILWGFNSVFDLQDDMEICE